MTNAEMIRRIEMVQDMMASSGTGWGRIVIELGKDGEPKHINYTLEMIPPEFRKNADEKGKN